VTRLLSLAFLLLVAANLAAESQKPANPPVRRVAEYYASMYARHYYVPVPLVRAIIERESNWQPCAVSPKGAKGLMQLMPATARRLGVRDSCNIEQNISGGALSGLVDVTVSQRSAACSRRLLRRRGHCCPPRPVLSQPRRGVVCGENQSHLRVASWCCGRS
jgi:hypothetical protein